MTSALIIASGRTSSKDNFEPGKMIGTISAIRRIALLFQEAGIRSIVVYGGDDSVKKLVPAMNLVFLPGDTQGEMLDSVKAGLSYLKGKCDEVLVSYVDIPMFSLRTVDALLRARGSVCIPSHEGRHGHPILLRESCFEHILSYTGAGGLKGAIGAWEPGREIVSVDDPGILSDIQKDGSYAALLAGHDISRLRLSYRFHIGRECEFYSAEVHQLLQLVEELGSLSDACKYVGISYSKGRKIVQTMETQLGQEVIASQQGGKGGGSSQLTATARQMMQQYDAFCRDAEGVLQALFQRHFGEK